MEKWSDGLTEDYKSWIYEEEDSRAVEILFLMHGVEPIVNECINKYHAGVVSKDFLQEVIILGVHRLIVDDGFIVELYDVVERLGVEWVYFLQEVEESFLYSDVEEEEEVKFNKIL